MDLCRLQAAGMPGLHSITTMYDQAVLYGKENRSKKLKSGVCMCWPVCVGVSECVLMYVCVRVCVTVRERERHYYRERLKEKDYVRSEKK